MIRLVSSLAVAALLSGCQLLSTPDPVQTYRFGASELSAPSAAPMSARTNLTLRRVEFPDATRGDRILAVTGAETAYIKGARWVSPAERLFTETLEDTFADRAARVRVVGRQEIVDADMALDIDVRTFEARYASEGAAPMVHITVRGQLIGFPDRQVVSERTFAAAIPAGENRVSAIVDAFDRAIAQVNGEIVTWADQTAPAAPRN